MSATFPIYPAHTAVLSMDCQTGIVSLYTKDDEDAFLARASNAINHARSKGMMVIHVQVGFRHGLSKALQGLLGAPSSIAPKEGEIVVTTYQGSALAGTDLVRIFRANDIDTLVIFGIATSGVVFSTLLHANYEDFRLAVIKDCCADLHSHLHDFFINIFFPSHAAVLSVREFVEAS